VIRAGQLICQSRTVGELDGLTPTNLPLKTTAFPYVLNLRVQALANRTGVKPHKAARSALR